MTKQSQKSKQTLGRSRNSSNNISFNSYSFDLGNKKILTDYLNRDTKDIIIKLYKSLKFDDYLYKQKLNLNGSVERQKIVVLKEVEAVEVIKDVVLRQKRLTLKRQIQKLKNQLQQHQSPPNPPSPFLNTNYYLQNLKNIIKRETTNLNQQFGQLQRKTLNKNKILSKLQHNCIKIQKQLFILSIVMIIETNNVENPTGDMGQIISIIIFEQCYKPIQTNKRSLIQLIGDQAYKLKVLSALRLYEYSKSEEGYYNPTFIACHDCMRVVENINYPQNELACMNVSKQYQIKSSFSFAPQQYLQKILNRNHFSQIQSNFSHPYIEYHYLESSKKQSQFACRRHWCGQCYVKYKRNMNLSQCQFCDRICRCLRCRKFQKLTQYLAHYLKLGGCYQELRLKMAFHKVFNKFGQYLRQQTVGAGRSWTYKRDLSQMYEKYSSLQKDEDDKSWGQIPFGQILAGIQPANNTQYELGQSVLFHSDKRRKNKLSQNNLQQLSRKKHRYKIEIKKQQNLQAKISGFSQQKVKSFIQAQKQQFNVLKRKFQSSKIFRFTDPLKNPKICQKIPQLMIISQSKFKKNERKFLQNVQIKQVNPFKRIQAERQYLKVKRLNLQKDINQIQNNSQKQSFNNNQPLRIQEQNCQKSNQNANNYGIMWQ